MDALTTLTLVAIGLALLGLVASLCGGAAHAAQLMSRRWRMRAAMAELRRDLRHQVEAHARRPRPRHRHDGHCPACGRFARVTSAGPRGVRTRCTVHGVRLRRAIGYERTLVSVEAVPATVTAAPHTGPVVELRDAMRPTVRLADWLDGPIHPPLTLAPRKAA